jgi:uncharacterized membrane protein YhaH (DUF805 family)
MAQYYLVKDGQRVGPLAIDQLTQYGLTPETLVWTDGMTDWVQASQIPEVAALLAPKPAPAPAPAPQPAPAPAPQPVQQPQPQYQAPQPQYQQPQPQYQQPYQQAAMGNYVATPQLGFMDAVKICLKKYFDFKGRARRSEYWWFMLAIYIVNAIINGGLYSVMGGLIAKKQAIQQAAINDIFSGNGIDTAAIEAQDPTTTIWILGLLMFVIFIALFIPQLSATARRLHDVGKSGHLQWLHLLCGLGGPLCMILCIPDGKPEPNKYGESPKYVQQQ